MVDETPCYQGKLAYSWHRQSAQASLRPLLILPGFPGGQAGIRHLVQSLARTRDVLVVEPLGCGASDRFSNDERAQDFDTQAILLLQLLNTSEAPAFDLLGLSLGGVWAQYLLAHAHGKIADTVLAATTARLRARERALVDHVLAQLASNLALADITKSLILAQFRPEFFYQPGAMMLIEHFATQLKLDRDGFVGNFQSLKAHDCRASLASWHGRVEVLVGQADTMFPPALAAELAEALPNACMSVLPDLGHTMWVEAPEVFRNAVEAAFSRMRAVE